MFGQTLAIVRNTFLESIRQPIFFVLVMAGGILQIFNSALANYGMGIAEEEEVTGDDKLLLDVGLATILVCATLLAAFIATSVLSREIENKTALTVVSKPVGRPMFVLGKYIGVTSAILMAAVLMFLFFLFAVRHKVMSTASDTYDGPVLIFLSLAVLISIAIGIWGNFFYGWVFSSTSMLIMLPLVLIAYVLTMSVSKEWAFQSIATDFKPQVTLAGLCVLMGVLVLTAVALVCSTRLGQVMTVVVCTGVFMLGLLSNYLFGRQAFNNQQVGVIASVEYPSTSTLMRGGDQATIKFKQAPRASLNPGDSIYYAADPAGASMAVPAHERFAGSLTDNDAVFIGKDKALTIVSVPDETSRTIVNIGGINLARQPREGDYVFEHPTETKLWAKAAWSVIPNMQYFWMVDAVTQGHPITGRYIALAGSYSLVQVTAFLSLAVILFQRRDIG
ncbi:MAG: ABC transporter permease [Phycisphaeraceae bacterium]|nr:ABC transporter permease [Phycisphaerales bacterium]MCB9842661.1 ABC transporter permease [Phycisphaeraceae bacterium]